ncbi:MAG: hypothetical protein IT233_03300 [Bacteroidia bacterium]|nr:hypothetical protein [Bacteroidia bacterium]
MFRILPALLVFLSFSAFSQVKFGDVIRDTKTKVNTVKNTKQKVDPIVEKKEETPQETPQDTTKKKNDPVKTDGQKTDNLAIGEEGDEKNKDGKGGKVKQSKEFIKDSKGSPNGTTTPPPSGNLVDPNSQKKSMAIGDEGAEDEKKKGNKSKSTDNNTVNPK